MNLFKPTSAGPYVVPFLIFSIFLAAEGWFPNDHYLIYPWKTLLVGAAILLFWKNLPNLVPTQWLASVLIGVLCVALWIELDPILVRYDHPLVGRNPFLLYTPPLAWTLYGFRLLGLTLCVPIMEEIFWRGFLMRVLIRENFSEVPMGTYQPFSFFCTTAAFATVHGAEWPLAVVVGLIYGTWFVKTKRLGDVILAHATTNFLLGLYCLAANDWHFLSIVSPVVH